VLAFTALLLTTIPGAWAFDTDVMRAQHKLQTLGYNTGGADGLLGPQTRHAIKVFQEKNNLQATGTLDAPTLAALGLAPPPTESEATLPVLPPPPTPWRPVLTYLRYADSQPARVVSYVTERFRQNLAPPEWIAQMMEHRTGTPPLRLSWKIEQIDMHDTDEPPRATVYVRSTLRIDDATITRREIFALVREGKADWLIDMWQGEVLPASQTAPKPDS
jgi:peptidoglycan hydrolase-like protein with peptidoglycan-binding domain